MKRGEAPFRIIRDGKWLSVTLSDLDEVTDQDLALQTRSMAERLRVRLASGGWVRDGVRCCWRRAVAA